MEAEESLIDQPAEGPTTPPRRREVEPDDDSAIVFSVRRNPTRSCRTSETGQRTSIDGRESTEAASANTLPALSRGPTGQSISALETAGEDEWTTENEDTNEADDTAAELMEEIYHTAEDDDDDTEDDELEDNDEDDEMFELDGDELMEEVQMSLESGGEPITDGIIIDSNVQDTAGGPAANQVPMVAVQEEGGTTQILTIQDILQRLGGPNALQRLLGGGREGGGHFQRRSERLQHQRERPPRPEFEKVPSEEGQRLMKTGRFGCPSITGSKLRKSAGAASKIFARETADLPATRAPSWNAQIAQTMLPSTRPDQVIHFNRAVYNGQFSEDGSFFYSCDQAFRIRLYNTSNPYRWKHFRTYHYADARWTITDATLSPDNAHLAYSSICPGVYLAQTDPSVDAEPLWLDFSGRSRHQHGWSARSFGIWSIRFSGDGGEIVAGASAGGIVVYDLAAQKPSFHIDGHDADVNAVCYGDKSSPHVIYSGSDDTSIKVWDRRSLADNRPAGLLVGHVEGLTYIDSRGDGRYVLSNGKDQTMKLWDIRKMYDPSREEEVSSANLSVGYDYRMDSYDYDTWRPNPHDNSVVTYRGHKVERTLIRCHFSPPTSSDSRYVYTGSRDGKVYIYNIDGTIAKTINVRKAISTSGRSSQTTVRDVAWHPNAPIIAASGVHETGSVSTYSWNDGLDADEMWNGGQIRDSDDEPEVARYDARMTPLTRAEAQAQSRHSYHWWGNVGDDSDEDI